MGCGIEEEARWKPKRSFSRYTLSFIPAPSVLPASAFVAVLTLSSTVLQALLPNFLESAFNKLSFISVLSTAATSRDVDVIRQSAGVRAC